MNHAGDDVTVTVHLAPQNAAAMRIAVAHARGDELVREDGYDGDICGFYW